MEHIESTVARAILDKKDFVEIDGRSYEVSQPTLGTLVMVSELVAKLPKIKALDEHELLDKAKDAEGLAEIAATMILGAKRIKEHRMVTVPRREATGLFSWLRLRKAVKSISYKEGVTELQYLSEYLLDNVSITEIAQIISTRLGDMELAPFFVITTSLSGANLLKSTKEVEETASGD